MCRDLQRSPGNLAHFLRPHSHAATRAPPCPSQAQVWTLCPHQKGQSCVWEQPAPLGNPWGMRPRSCLLPAPQVRGCIPCLAPGAARGGGGRGGLLRPAGGKQAETEGALCPGLPWHQRCGRTMPSQTRIVSFLEQTASGTAGCCALPCPPALRPQGTSGSEAGPCSSPQPSTSASASHAPSAGGCRTWGRGQRAELRLELVLLSLGNQCLSPGLVVHAHRCAHPCTHACTCKCTHAFQAGPGGCRRAGHRRLLPVAGGRGRPRPEPCCCTAQLGRAGCQRPLVGPG